MNRTDLQNLIAYLSGGTDDKDDYQIKYKDKEDDTVTIRVKLKNRIFVYEGFPDREQAAKRVYREILLKGVDMLIDDDLWKRYVSKLKGDLNA